LNAITRFGQRLVQGMGQGLEKPHQAGRLAAALTLAPILCVAVGVFTLDLFIPKGVADGVLYVAPVAWIALWSNRHEASLVVSVALLCTVCAIAGFLLSPPELLWLGLANRGITIFVVWLTVVLSLTRKRVEEEVKALRGLLPICSYCKKIRDDKGYWKQIEVYIAANSQADFSHGLCPECGIEHYPEIFSHEHTGTHS
jgi:MFS family permease